MKPALSALFALLAVLSYAQAREIPDQEIPQGATYELGFSPGGTALAVALHAIQSGNSTLLVACYEFTSRAIAQALIAAAGRGVQVSVIADYKASHDRYSLVIFIEQHGILVRRDLRYAIEHNKFMMIDADSVETGSFNYTSASICMIFSVIHCSIAYSGSLSVMNSSSALLKYSI